MPRPLYHQKCLRCMAEWDSTVEHPKRCKVCDSREFDIPYKRPEWRQIREARYKAKIAFLNELVGSEGMGRKEGKKDADHTAAEPASEPGTATGEEKKG